MAESRTDLRFKDVLVCRQRQNRPVVFCRGPGKSGITPLVTLFHVRSQWHDTEEQRLCRVTRMTAVDDVDRSPGNDVGGIIICCPVAAVGKRSRDSEYISTAASQG